MWTWSSNTPLRIDFTGEQHLLFNLRKPIDMNCTNCGYIMDPTDLYCQNCGTKSRYGIETEGMDTKEQIKENTGSGQTEVPLHFNVSAVQAVPNSKRGAIPFSFGAALICFLLPFLDLTCGGTKIVSYPGLELVAGKDMPNGDMFGEGREESQVPSNIWAIIALGSCIVGFYVFITRQKGDLTTGKLAAIVGVTALIILQITIRNSSQLQAEGAEGVVTINFLLGYWGCILAIATAGILCHIVLQEKG